MLVTLSWFFLVLDLFETPRWDLCLRIQAEILGAKARFVQEVGMLNILRFVVHVLLIDVYVCVILHCLCLKNLDK